MIDINKNTNTNTNNNTNNNNNNNTNRKYSFADGIVFFKEVFALFIANYNKVNILTFAMFATLLLSISIPLINIVAPLFFPIIFLMYIYGIHLQVNSKNKERIFTLSKLNNFKLLKTPFNKENVFTLLSYAGFLIIITSLVAFLTTIMDGGVLKDILLQNKLNTLNSLNNENAANFDVNNIGQATIFAMIFYAVCSTIIFAAQYFAPLLILQQKMKLLKALFFSLFTCYFQWKALCSFFLMLGLVIVLPIIIISLVIAIMSAILTSGLISVILLFLMVYYLFLMLFLTHLSQYYLYKKFFINFN